eukprot:1564482-Alexandrium_andersonii.AAC.1
MPPRRTCEARAARCSHHAARGTARASTGSCAAWRNGAAHLCLLRSGDAFPAAECTWLRRH